MIRRPLDPRFSQAVLHGRKITTIRQNPWPVGVPIMLYNWTGAPYRSKQAEVAAVVVEETTTIHIGRFKGESGIMHYCAERSIHSGRKLWQCEGFLSKEDMDEWFRCLIKAGQTATKVLMRFRLVNDSAMPALGHDQSKTQNTKPI